MPSPGVSGQFDYMLIDPEKKRCVVSVLVRTNPLKRGAMPIWYKEGPRNVFSTKNNPLDRWHDHLYRLECDTIYWRWLSKGIEHAWNRVSQTEVPEWFSERVQRVYARMDLAEQAAASDGD